MQNIRSGPLQNQFIVKSVANFICDVEGAMKLDPPLEGIDSPYGGVGLIVCAVRGFYL